MVAAWLGRKATVAHVLGCSRVRLREPEEALPAQTARYYYLKGELG
jgi:hypothetical protein